MSGMPKLRQTLRSSCILQKIEPYVDYYKKQIKLYNETVHNILKNEIDLILPQKCGIITALVSGFIELAYEGISIFLHDRRHKTLHKAAKAMDIVKAMDIKMTIQCINSCIWKTKW